MAKVKRIAAHLGATDLRRLRDWASERARVVGEREATIVALRRLDELAEKPEGHRLMLCLGVHLTSSVYQPGEAVEFQVKRGRKYKGIWVTNDRIKKQVRRRRGWVWVPLLRVYQFVDYEPNASEAKAAEGQERGEGLARLLSGPGLMDASTEGG